MSYPGQGLSQVEFRHLLKKMIILPKTIFDPSSELSFGPLQGQQNYFFFVARIRIKRIELPKPGHIVSLDFFYDLPAKIQQITGGDCEATILCRPLLDIVQDIFDYLFHFFPSFHLPGCPGGWLNARNHFQAFDLPYHGQKARVKHFFKFFCKKIKKNFNLIIPGKSFQKKIGKSEKVKKAG
jgi:hypothetical protein